MSGLTHKQVRSEIFRGSISMYDPRGKLKVQDNRMTEEESEALFDSLYSWRHYASKRKEDVGIKE